MEKSIAIQLELSKISVNFDKFISTLESRIVKNKYRVSIDRNELDDLTNLQIQINNIMKTDIHDLRSNVHDEKKELQEELNTAKQNCSYKDGQISQMKNILEMCYIDYKNNNRTDATLAIEAAVNDANVIT